MLCGPRHISTAGVALHLTPKQAHIFHELDSHVPVTEQIREKVLFGPPSSRSIPRPYDDLGTNGSPAGDSRTRQQLHLFSAPLYCKKRDGRRIERCVPARVVADRRLHEACWSMGST